VKRISSGFRIKLPVLGTVLPARLSGRIKGIDLPLASDIMVGIAGKATEILRL
jgi:hypothetical protein